MIASLVSLRKSPQLDSPHLHGGSNVEKLVYEFEAAHDLWPTLAPAAGLESLADKDLLDLGCGWGGKALRYALEAGPRSITGIDLAGVYDPAVPTRYAEEHGIRGCRFLEGTAEAVPLADSSVDVVLMEDVLEHVGDPQRVMAECARVLRPGGLVIVKFPSIRMIHAHHLDRALTFPGLQYVLSLGTWAAALNDRLLRSGGSLGYEPFDESVSSRFGGRQVTRNLNGLDYGEFERIVQASDFAIRRLAIVPSAPASLGQGAARRLWDALAALPALREPLGQSIVFVGVRPAGATR